MSYRNTRAVSTSCRPRKINIGDFDLRVDAEIDGKKNHFSGDTAANRNCGATPDPGMAGCCNMDQELNCQELKRKANPAATMQAQNRLNLQEGKLKKEEQQVMCLFREISEMLDKCAKPMDVCGKLIKLRAHVKSAWDCARRAGYSTAELNLRSELERSGSMLAGLRCEYDKQKAELSTANCDTERMKRCLSQARDVPPECAAEAGCDNKAGKEEDLSLVILLLKSILALLFALFVLLLLSPKVHDLLGITYQPVVSVTKDGKS